MLPRRALPIVARPRWRRAFVCTAALVIALAGATARAEVCGTDCTQTACSADCTEDALRDAIAKVNDCIGNGGWTGRTITVEGAQCDATSEVHMLSDAAAFAAFPNSTCPDDPEEFALCIRNDDVHIIGAGRTFLYDGFDPCGQCAGQCPTGAALFTLKGNRNTVEDLTFRYFPEGIHIRTGNGHSIIGVHSDRICEDAFTIDTTAGTGQLIRDTVLLGNQPPAAGHTCILNSGGEGVCGTDKAVQVNGGASTIRDNVIDLIGQPISIDSGTHLIQGNTTTGSTTDQNVCQSYTVTGSAHVTFADNTVDHCKFGFRLDGAAVVTATGNTVTNPWLSAFNVRGGARLKGEGNRLKTRSGGFTTVSDVQRGLVVARNDDAARIDLGGGDAAGSSVIDGTACASGGDCSTGGNVFCSTGGGTQVDVWNVTDCPCLDLLCDGIPGLCAAHACAPLDATGACDGSGGGGASVGARNNCFSGGSADVLDPAPITTNISGATACAAGVCDF
jgi:hypothetical protein